MRECWNCSAGCRLEALRKRRRGTGEKSAGVRSTSVTQMGMGLVQSRFVAGGSIYAESVVGAFVGAGAVGTVPKCTGPATPTVEPVVMLTL